MRLRLLWVGLAAALTAASWAQFEAQGAAPRGKYEGSSLERVVRPSQPTALIAVTLRPGLDPGLVAAGYGLAFESASIVPGRYVLRAATIAEAASAAQTLAVAPGVISAAQVEFRPVERHAFVPNDPFFPHDTPTAGYPGQWYLKNALVAGRDVRVEGAWNRNVTGLGVRVGMVDDGIQTNHPDLATNYVGATSYDFGQNNADPSPVYSDDNHGTATAGIVAARGGNGVGITGVAPFAQVSMLRLDFGGSSNAQVVDAINAFPNDLKIKNHSYGWLFIFEPGTDIAVALANTAADGMIHVRSAGNSRASFGEDANKYIERNLPQVIAVAALGSDGVFADYSSYGTNVMVTAPSSSSDGLLRFLTTDRTGVATGYTGSDWSAFGPDPFGDGNYTYRFGGTSASAPIVSGALALAKQVNPDLDVRLAKHLLARTSDPVDLNDSSLTSGGGWRTNGAGLRYNPNYGFGLLDADELTDLAEDYSGVTPLQTWTTGNQSVVAQIPDNNTAGVTRTFAAPAGPPLEEVTVRINAAHDYRGDIQVWITSPSGMTSRVCNSALGDNGLDMAWTFTTNAFWGEDPQGTWSVNVRDVQAQDQGLWSSYQVTLRMGEPVLAQTEVSGSVELRDFAGAYSAETVEVSFYAPGGTTPVETQNVLLQGNGALVLSTQLSGLHDIAVKGRTWLRQRVAGVNLAGGTVGGLNFSLRNGDVNGDNTVNLDDYFDLADAYRTRPGDGGWNPNADLDGSEFVDLDDYFILADQYRQTGD